MRCLVALDLMHDRDKAVGRAATVTSLTLAATPQSPRIINTLS